VELLAQARACLEAFPPEPAEAAALFEKALAAAPKRAEVLDAYGAFLCEEGDSDRARELLLRSAALHPKAGAEKFLYLAQLSSGEEALSHYEQGAAVIAAAAAGSATSSNGSTSAGSASAQEVAGLRRQLASVRASIAELFMTDLCDLEDAEERCEEAIRAGREADMECLEVKATEAMLRKVQGRLEEARTLALECARKAKAPQELPVAAAEATANEEVAAVLQDETLIALCRTLLDLGETVEAKALLMKQLEQDEEDIQVWYLLGYCHLIDEETDGVKECVQRALQLCARVEGGNEWKRSLKSLLRDAKKLVTPNAGSQPE